MTFSVHFFVAESTGFSMTVIFKINAVIMEKDIKSHLFVAKNKTFAKIIIKKALTKCLFVL